jgi:hypothetical protein
MISFESLSLFYFVTKYSSRFSSFIFLFSEQILFLTFCPNSNCYCHPVLTESKIDCRIVICRSLCSNHITVGTFSNFIVRLIKHFRQSNCVLLAINIFVHFQSFRRSNLSRSHETCSNCSFHL